MKGWIISSAFLAVFIGIGLTLKHLVKNNKIKSNVITRFFYEEDSDFLSKWRKQEDKGFLIYALKNTMMFAFAMGVIGMFSILTKRCFFGYVKGEIMWISLGIGAVMGLIDSIISWMSSEVRARNIRDKEKETSDSQES